MKSIFTNQRLWRLFSCISILSLANAQINLGIRRDMSLQIGIPSGRFPALYSGVADFAAGVVNTDEQLAWLARKAYQEMMAFGLAGHPSAKFRPALMAALKVDINGGTRVYFASSMRQDTGGTGVNGFLYKFLDKDQTIFKQFGQEAAPLCGAMNICQMTMDGKGHKSDAHCGEPMCLAAFYADNGPGISLHELNPVMAAYAGTDPIKGTSLNKIIGPCTWSKVIPQDGSPRQHGCLQLVEVLGVRYLEEPEKPEEPEEPSDFPMTPVTQQPTGRRQVCLKKIE